MPLRKRTLWSVGLLLLTVGLFLGYQQIPPTDPAKSAAIPAFSIPALPADRAYEHAFVLGDMGTGGPDQRRVAAVMAERARQVRLDFMLTVGDNIYPSGASSADDPQFRSKFESVYADPALAVPIYPSLGNHDHRGDPDAQVAYSRNNPLWRMTGRYYSTTRTLKDGTEIGLFAIDTTPIEHGEAGVEQQVAWLSAELTRSTAHWKIVFGHHPLYSNGDHGGSTAVREALEPTLTDNRVDLYLAGHDHHMEVLPRVAGVSHVIAGAAGGPDWAYPVPWTEETIYAATGGGVVLLRIDRAHLVLEFIRMDGTTQYAHVIGRN